MNSLSRRTAGSASRWRSTTGWLPGRGSCGEARFVFCLSQDKNQRVRTEYMDLAMKESVCPQDGGEYMQFLRQSHQEALKEEERRHRFVAEKHCGLIQSIADIMNKVSSLPQIESVLSIFLDFSFFIESTCQSKSVSSSGSLWTMWCP